MAHKALLAAALWIRGTGAPLADRGARHLGHAVGNGTIAGLRGAWRVRTILAGLLARVGWWWSLWLATSGALALLGVTPLPPDAQLVTPFAIGVGIAAAIAWLSPERHLRLAALALGAIHIALIATTLAALG